jgi:two-component system, NtrC family, sensor kinase
MKLFSTLSAKIILILAATLSLGLAASTYVNIESENGHLIKAVQVSAERSSNVIKRGLRRAMQQNQQSDIHASIAEFAKEPGIDRIRIYDKRGNITYSSKDYEIGAVVNASAEACTMCHGSASVFTKTNSDQYVRVYDSPHGHRILGFINPVKNEPTCWNADCHAHSPDQTVLGVLDIQLSLRDVDMYISSSTRSLLLSSLVTLVLVILAAAVFVYRGIHLPVKRVIQGTKRLAAGDFDHLVTVPTHDEIGELAQSFNTMADQLSEAQRELVDWSERLEEKVRQKSKELKESESQIVHMERMASLGKLSSMIAHELNNPLAGILTFARLTEKRLSQPDLTDAQRTTMTRDLRLIADEAKRCGDIVKNLLFFARGQEGVYSQCDIGDLIHKSIRLIQHQMDMQKIAVQTSLPDVVRRVTCDQNQIQQVILALIMNAIEAMPDGGTLTISFSFADQHASLDVTDTGVGIAPEDLQKIYEPFFTTKDSGAGVGLGLSIVYGIVKHHHGDITVRSALGKGSSFLVRLPVHQPTDNQVSASTPA